MSSVLALNAKPSTPTCLSFTTQRDRKSTRLNSSHGYISYAVFCLKKKKSMRSRLVIGIDARQTSVVDCDMLSSFFALTCASWAMLPLLFGLPAGLPPHSAHDATQY